MINFIPINHISWINKKNYSYALKFFCVNKQFALKNCQVRIISPFFSINCIIKSFKCSNL